MLLAFREFLHGDYNHVCPMSPLDVPPPSRQTKKVAPQVSFLFISPCYVLENKQANKHANCKRFALLAPPREEKKMGNKKNKTKDNEARVSASFLRLIG